MGLISRNERGKLELRTLDLQVFLDGLLDQCTTAREIEWLTDHIRGALDGSEQDKRDALGITDDEEDDR